MTSKRYNFASIAIILKLLLLTQTQDYILHFCEESDILDLITMTQQPAVFYRILLALLLFATGNCSGILQLQMRYLMNARLVKRLNFL